MAVGDGKWHHIAITVSRTDVQGIRFYDNGQLKTTANPTGRQGDLSNSAPLTIGMDTFGFSSRYKGILDELEIFSRALSPGEVKSIYAASSAGKCKVATAYVTNNLSSNVTPITLSNNSPSSNIATPGAKGGPEFIAITPDGRWAYVVRSGFGGNQVTPIDLASNMADVPISVPRPTGIAITPNGEWAYVTTLHSVTPIELASNSVGTPIQLQGLPFGIAITPDGRYAWVTNSTTGKLSQIDLSNNTITFDATLGIGIHAVAITPDGSRAYVTNVQSNKVTPFDLSSKSAMLALGGFNFPNRIAITPDGTAAYVTNGGSGQPGNISKITLPAHAISMITVGSNPSGIAITPDGAFAYVSSAGLDRVHPVNLGTNVVGPGIIVGDHPSGLAIKAS
jgi:DNA-binding beta-propeller fold protein YncE